MATQQSPRGPHDTHAERVCLAAGLYSPEWWWEARHHHHPDDYSYREHQEIARCLDELGDVGPFIPDNGDWLNQWTGTHPYTPPTALTVRISAVATMALIRWQKTETTHVDLYAPIHVPDRALAAIAAYADGLHERAARTIREHALKRAEILELRYRLRDLTE